MFEVAVGTFDGQVRITEASVHVSQESGHTSRVSAGVGDLSVARSGLQARILGLLGPTAGPYVDISDLTACMCDVHVPMSWVQAGSAEVVPEAALVGRASSRGASEPARLAGTMRDRGTPWCCERFATSPLATRGACRTPPVRANGSDCRHMSLDVTLPLEHRTRLRHKVLARPVGGAGRGGRMATSEAAGTRRTGGTPCNVRFRPIRPRVIILRGVSLDGTDG